jgi:hypothetical protein
MDSNWCLQPVRNLGDRPIDCRHDVVKEIMLRFYKICYGSIALPLHAQSYKEAIALSRKDYGAPNIQPTEIQLWHDGEWWVLDSETEKFRRQGANIN